MKVGISTLGCGEGESRSRGGSECPGLDDGMDMMSMSSLSESSCDSSDEEDTSASASPSDGFGCRTGIVTVFFGVDASDEDEEEFSSEEDESDTTLLFRFLFLFLVALGCPGPIVKYSAWKPVGATVEWYIT
jgi:hypothetical protein